MNTPPGKGTTTVKPAESTANHASMSETGLSALLGGLFGVKGSGASSIPRPALACLLALATTLGALTFISTPAFALRVHTFSASFGNEGSGDGEFKEPSGVAVNEVALGEVGDVYVVDQGNGRVEWFSPEGNEFKGEFDGHETPAGSFASPTAIAIDNSTNPLDPSVGDVYVLDSGHEVIDKFEPDGKYAGTIEKGAGGEPFGALDGVAVDSEGVVWVYQASGEIDSYSSALANEFISSRSSPFGTSPGFAVDSEDDLYVNRGGQVVAKLNSSGEALIEELGSETTVAVAVDFSSNNVYIDNLGTIGAFSSAGTFIERFGSEHLTEGSGVSVNSSSGAVYVADRSADAVRVFSEVQLPEVSTGEATNLEIEGTATLNGTVNPEGTPVTSCEFEYGPSTSYGATAECSPSPGSGSAPVAVSAGVTGLAGGIYHYRLVAGNANGENPGQDRTFVATTRPGITGESVSAVGTATATAGAQINPGGLPTAYHVEYGTSTSYGSITPEASVGAGFEAAGVQVHLSGLQPGTVYHFRFVATNELGAASGGDLQFVTPRAALSTSALPDGRSYELVSSTVGGDGEVYPPFTNHEPSGTTTESHQIHSLYPVRAAADGHAVMYFGEAPPSGGSGAAGQGFGDAYIAARTSTGWRASDISPPLSEHGETWQNVSSDFSLTFMKARELMLAPDAPQNCANLYSRSTSDGAFHALITSPETPGHCGNPLFAGVSTDNSSVVFESAARLTPDATQGEELQANIYDSVGGHLHLVNILPGGGSDVNATVGGVSHEHAIESTEVTEPEPGSLGGAVSADGSHIVWSDTSNSDLYVRNNPATPGASTALVATTADFWGASGDGTKILFTQAGDLFEYDVNARSTRDLTPAGSVLGVVGLSTDASYVYLVAEAALASNVGPGGDTATAGQPNLYFEHAGELRFIATLSPEDNSASTTTTLPGRPGDWKASLRLRTAQVTPDGRFMEFTSDRPLTGYDNNGGCRTKPGNPEVPCEEIFAYDASTQTLLCASCNPSGQPPVAAVRDPGNAAQGGGAFLPTPQGPGQESQLNNPDHQLRTLSADGGRIFFDTNEPLVPTDTNDATDVYEWERAGVGMCHNALGCVYLISSNLSNEEAIFIDASESGNDVFFTTRGRLLPDDQNEQVDVYDARVSGGFTATSTECTGTGCQGVPAAPPNPETPATATFQGGDNFPAAPPVKGKRTTSTRALTRALRHCRHLPRHKRRSCEARSRRRYGTTAQKLEAALARCKKDRRTRASCEVQARRTYKSNTATKRHITGRASQGA
jgi:hypothetical protein